MFGFFDEGRFGDDADRRLDLLHAPPERIAKTGGRRSGE